MLTQHARRRGARLPCHQHSHKEAAHAVLDREDSMVLVLRVNDHKVCALHDHLLNLLARNVTLQLLAPLICLLACLLRQPSSLMIAIWIWVVAWVDVEFE